jgi:hypothetical protein
MFVIWAESQQLVAVKVVIVMFCYFSVMVNYVYDISKKSDFTLITLTAVDIPCGSRLNVSNA